MEGCPSSMKLSGSRRIDVVQTCCLVLRNKTIRFLFFIEIFIDIYTVRRFTVCSALFVPVNPKKRT